MERPISVLLVEDNPVDVLLLQEAFNDLPETNLQIDQTDHLTKALELLETKNFDAVLLDLGLPDSQGLDTFVKLHSKHSHVPILVLTALEDEEVGLQIVRTGAQDFIVKGKIHPLSLSRSLRFAVERAERESRVQVDRELEMGDVESLAASPEAVTSTQLFSAGPLRLTHPDQFERIVERYAAMILTSLDLRNENRHPTYEPLQPLATVLGRIRCSSTDLIEIHTAALKTIMEGQSSARAQAIMAQGRLMILQLMGNLANFYRVGHDTVSGVGGLYPS
ncbi:MAG: response regulator [Leptospirales bacterium]|nr:response regulator [Leptospirales bacterium]